MAGKLSAKGMKMPFTDVEKNKGYYDAVLWLYNNGIDKGITEQAFNPGAKCTSAQLVSMLYNYDKLYRK